MSEIWYEVYPTLNRITAIEVEKVTDAFVTINGKRHGRYGEYTFYLPNLVEARAALIAYHEGLVGKATSMLEVRKRDLERAHNPQIKDAYATNPTN